MTFLPLGYELPKSSSGYFKIQPGENKVRLLSKPIIGWLDWMQIPGGGNKPLRFPMDKKPLAPIDPNKKISHFWTFIIWDYKDEGGKIKIWETTQSSIHRAIQNFSMDSDWGDPFNYDLKIFRSGEMAKTQYAVNPVSPKPVDTMVKNSFMAHPINLHALYEGKDPFVEVNEQTRTKAFWEGKAEASPNMEDLPPSFLSAQQSAELGNLIQIHISPVDALWMKNFLQACKISKLQDLPADRYAWAKRQVERKIEELKKTEFSDSDIPF